MNIRIVDNRSQGWERHLLYYCAGIIILHS